MSSSAATCSITAWGDPATVLALREVEQRQHRARLTTRRVLGDHGIRVGLILGRKGESLDAGDRLSRHRSISPNTMSMLARLAHRVRQHVALAHVVEDLEVGEAGRPDLAAVGPVRAVGNEIDPELALRRLHRAIGLAAGT